MFFTSFFFYVERSRLLPNRGICKGTKNGTSPEVFLISVDWTKGVYKVKKVILKALKITIQGENKNKWIS